MPALLVHALVLATGAIVTSARCRDGQEVTLLGPSRSPNFGHSIAGVEGGGLVAIGSWTQSDAGAGALSVYDLNDGARLLARVERSGGCFGRAVAAGAGWFAVAAPTEDIEGVHGVGRVFLYTLDEAGALVETGSLDGRVVEGRQSSKRFGMSLCGSGERLAVFASGQDCVCLLERAGRAWDLVDVFESPDPDAELGGPVGLSKRYLACATGRGSTSPGVLFVDLASGVRLWLGANDLGARGRRATIDVALAGDRALVCVDGWRRQDESALLSMDLPAAYAGDGGVRRLVLPQDAAIAGAADLSARFAIAAVEDDDGRGGISVYEWSADGVSAPRVVFPARIETSYGPRRVQLTAGYALLGFHGLEGVGPGAHPNGSVVVWRLGE